MNDKQDIACQWNLLPKNIFSWYVTQCVFHAGLTQVSNQVTWTSEMYYSFVQIKIKKSNQIRIISRNMTYKEVTNWYKMVHKRQTDMKAYNIQHIQHTKTTKFEIQAGQAQYYVNLYYCQVYHVHYVLQC